MLHKSIVNSKDGVRGSYRILRLGGKFQSLVLIRRVCFSMPLLGGSEGMPPPENI